jgi:SAM-dependent methyltransferase
MHKQNLESEMKVHAERFYIDSGRWYAHPWLVSRQRHWLKNDVQKIRFYGYLCSYIRNKPYKYNARILLAPVGDGADLGFLQGLYSEVHGIDISPIQLAKCPRIILTKEGDILESGYQSGSFDIIVVSLFLHHLHKVGLEPFIKEFHRILRKGGTLAIMEPSAMYPVGWFTALASRILGDFPSKVEDEKPLSPYSISRIIRRAGFNSILIRGATFNHIVFPFFVQSIINSLDFLFRVLWPFKLFSESVCFFSEKK